MDLIDPKKLPKHVAIVMDGNGRWAQKRGKNRVRGHQKGVETVKEIVSASIELGIPWLTLYAFSEENWKRPKHEIQGLMKLLKKFLKGELAELQEKKIRLQTIGRTDKLPEDIRKDLLDTIKITAPNKNLVLTLALSYGGRQEILDAIKKIAVKIEKNIISAGEISEKVFPFYLYSTDMPDPDLLIRTGGECRVSNFLLWQIAYTELYFTSTLWPDFCRAEYMSAIQDFQKRVRKFGETGE